MKNKCTPDIRFLGFTKNWDEHKLKDVANFIRGSFPQPYTNPDWYDEEHGRPFVQVADIGFDLKLNKDTKLHISKVAEPKSRFVEAGKVVVALQGSIEKSIGRVAITQYDAFFDRTILIFESYKTEIDNHYFAQVIQKLFQREKEKAWGATISTITKEALSDFVIGVPNIEEQTKIGNFLKQLDDTIALHQQELTILKQTKQGFLQKMFPKEGEPVPEVRFPEFTGDWKQRRLDSMVDRLKSYPLSRDVETSDYTGYKYIHYGDIHTKVADKIDKSSNLPNIKAGNYELLEKGDLVLADASEDYKGIATPAVITIDTPYKLVSGLHTIALRPKQVDSLFLYYLINSPVFRKYGYRMGTGMKVFGISVTNLLKFESIFPSLEEQTKIGKFFERLDNTIALHQCELDTLKETKKAFLQKMFA